MAEKGSMIDNDNVVELKNDYKKEPTEPDLKMEAQIKPLHNNVFCRLDEKEEVKGGIVIPDMAQGKRQEATVIAVGPGFVTEAGVLVPCSVEAGDRVLLPKWGGTEEDIHGVKYSVVQDKDILTIIVPVAEEEEVEGDE